jgi:hypothetical protein
MKPFFFFLIFLLVIGSASATFPITINGKTVPNSANTADKTEADQAQILYQGKAQGFTLPTDPDISSITRGSIDFKRDSKAPPISQFFFFPSAAPLTEPTQQSEGPTGAITYTVDEGPEKGPIVAMIFLVTIITVFFVIKTQGAQIKIILAIIILAAALFTSIQITNTPTALLVQEYAEPESQEIAPASAHILSAFTLTWTHGGPVTFFPEGGAPECSDGIDNTDFEDLLVDCADPGCHTDGDESNPGSCDPTDDLEQDMLEYDQAPVVDNQIDVYDIVNWVQYFNGDFSVLVHCIDPACSNQAGTANCVGDTDPNDDAALTAADQTFLQTTQVADTDSRTVPASPICFNP